MKKQLLIAAVLLCVWSGAAFAQVILDADFSSAQGYKDGPVVNQPTGASSLWLDGNATVAPAVNIVVQGEALVTTVNGVESKWVYIMIPVQKGKITVKWDWRYAGTAAGFVDTGFCISDSENFKISGADTNPTFNEQGAMVRMTQDTTNGTGVIDVRNGDGKGGGSYAVTNPVLYLDGKKISMRMEIDIAALTLDVYATREGETEVQIASGYGLRRNPTAATGGLNCLTIWEDVTAATSVGNQCIIDNIRITGAAASSASDAARYK